MFIRNLSLQIFLTGTKCAKYICVALILNCLAMLDVVVMVIGGDGCFCNLCYLLQGVTEAALVDFSVMLVSLIL